jgi:hypothetical protein
VLAKRLIAAAGQVKTRLAQTMPAPAPPALESDIAAALDWWRVAGVDATFTDAPRKWLADPETTAASTPEPAAKASTPLPPSRPQIGSPRERWPTDLAAFRDWWLAEPSLDEGGLAPRVAPSGEARAELMILVAMPEETDRERLLSGSGGRLLDSFLEAALVPAEKIYKASVLPRHTPLADWQALAADGIGVIVSHHVALASPRRLLVLGQIILPLCGHDPAQRGQKLQTFNHEGGSVPALYEAGLDRLLEKPALRSRFWQRWLDWTDGQKWDEGQS